MIPAYPLAWPAAWKRTAVRTEAKFSQRGKALSVAQAVERVRAELGRMGVNQNDVVVSTNVPLRLDGWPRSDGGNPLDPGAAVYWMRRKQTQVMAIDTYYRVADNLAAIAACLDAMRALDRHGGEILNRAFTGFTALPAPLAEPQWWGILECPRDAPLDVIRAQYRRIAAQAHPDRPHGSTERMAAVNRAWEQAQEARR